MTTLTINTNTKICSNGKKHTPNKAAISDVRDDQYTFCEVCEQNIERWYNDTDPDCLPRWTDWKLSN